MPDNETLTCRGCNTVSKPFPKTNAVRDMRIGSGDYHPIFSHGADLFWLCPTCYGTAQGLALQILNIVKDDHVYFPNLINQGQVIWAEDC